jgi:O-antigen/teichoic acid export membrane protein
MTHERSASPPSEEYSASRSVMQRLPLPEGTLPVGLGLLISGICSFAFFRVGKFALGDEHAFKPVTGLWFATFALAPGFFLPLEQELGRALSARRALGQGGQPVVRRVLVLGAVLATFVTIGLIAAGPWLRGQYFQGSWVMVAALVIAIIAYAPTHLARGVCAGTGRFGPYGVVLAADGVARVGLCLVLAAFSVKAVGAYGMVVAVAPLVGVVIIATRRHLSTDPGPESSWAEITPNLGWLLLGAVMAALLVNAGPLALALITHKSDDALVTRFGYGVILARIPLFLFQAIQAALLPRLSRLAAQRAIVEFRHGFTRLLMVLAGIGAIGTAAAYVVGPKAIKVLYNSQLSRRTLTALALGSVCYMMALATAQAVIALRGHAWVALGWTIGVSVFVVFVALTRHDPFRRVELGVLAGSLAALATFAIALRSRLRAGAVPDAGSVIEAVTDQPLEA